MKKFVFVLFVVLGFSLSAQTTDHNTEKGFIAKGYDVVAYFSNIDKEGNNKYVTTHDGVKYKFSSQKNLETFNANPEKYTPQYGGYCAYALGSKGEKVDVDPETYEIRDGKLYLFYNSWGNNTLKSWLKESPNDLRAKADTYWKTLKLEK